MKYLQKLILNLFLLEILIFLGDFGAELSAMNQKILNIPGATKVKIVIISPLFDQIFVSLYPSFHIHNYLPVKILLE